MQTELSPNHGDLTPILSSPTHLEFKVEKGSNKHLKIQSIKNAGNPFLQTNMEPAFGEGTNEHMTMQTESRHNNGDPPSIYSFNQTHVESKPGGEINEQLEMQTQSRHDDGDLPAEVETSGFSLPTSSTSSSSPDSPFGYDDPLGGFFAKSAQDGDPLPAPEPVFTADDSSQTLGWSMVSATPRSAKANCTSENFSQNFEWSNSNASPMISPAVQTMGQPPAYDPNRLPASMFGKPATPMEWSVASNDSLFSLHIGNNSFSRDLVIQLGKSGELFKPEERNNLPPNPNHISEAKYNELNNFSAHRPPPIKVASDKDQKSVNKKEEPVIKEDPVVKEDPIVKEESSKDLKAPEEEKVEGHDNNAPPTKEVHFPSPTTAISDSKGLHPSDRTRTFSSPPRLSDESGKSNSSFAFPVLVNESGSSGSMKAPSEKPQEPEKQPEPSKAATPKEAQTRWFFCFACWPRCC